MITSGEPRQLEQCTDYRECLLYLTFLSRREGEVPTRIDETNGRLDGVGVPAYALKSTYYIISMHDFGPMIV